MKAHSAPFLFHADIEPEVVADGIRRQLLGFDSAILMARVAFEDGAIGYAHSHVHSQVSYVVSGEFDVVIDGVEQRLGPGDSFYVQPHVEHGAICRRAGVLIDVFSPAREDFLDGKEQEN